MKLEIKNKSHFSKECNNKKIFILVGNIAIQSTKTQILKTLNLAPKYFTIFADIREKEILIESIICRFIK